MPTTVQKVRGRGLTCKEHKTVQAKLLLHVNYYQAQTISAVVHFSFYTAEMLCIFLLCSKRNTIHELVQQS